MTYSDFVSRQDIANLFICTNFYSSTEIFVFVQAFSINYFSHMAVLQFFTFCLNTPPDFKVSVICWRRVHVYYILCKYVYLKYRYVQRNTSYVQMDLIILTNFVWPVKTVLGCNYAKTECMCRLHQQWQIV